MHVLLLGKLPPIQGGVARQTWLASQDIAEAGHSISVLSNATAMPFGFKQMFLPGDDARLQAGSDRMYLNMLEGVPPQSYIPWAPPYFSQFMSLCMAQVEERRPDVIVGWYLEPYGVVATVIGKMFGIPVVLRHAGSDIGRMRELGGLTRFYDWALSSADRVISGRNQEAIDVLRTAGVEEHAILRCGGRRLCGSFTAARNAFDLSEVVDLSEDWYASGSLEADTVKKLIEWNRAGLENDGPVIGTYGKIAEVKGTYSLLDALELLAQRGESFRYRGLWSGAPGRLQHAVQYLHRKPALKGLVTILPPLAPWRMASFIRSCDAVAFLENRFPISFHGPQVPREVLACGRPLLLSREIFEKVYFKSQLRDNVNVMLVDDPRDVGTLAEQINLLLHSPELLKCLAHHAGALSRMLEAKTLRFDPVVDVIEELGGYERLAQSAG